MAEEDRDRYEKELNLVRRFVIQKPLKENATAFRVFQDDLVKKALENNGDEAAAKKEATAKWKDMTADEKREYNEKKKEHDAWFEELRKNRGSVSAYNLFLRDQMAKQKEKGETANFSEIAQIWKKSNQKTKEKYSEYAVEWKEKQEEHRDLYELAFGLKPRRPKGAFNFFLDGSCKRRKT